MTIDLGVEDVHEAGERDAEVGADQREHLDRGLVAVVGQLGHERPGQLAALGQRPAEPGVRALARQPQRLARQRRARGQRLDAPVVGAVALAGRAVLVDHHVAELAGRADRAAVQLAAEDQPAADPGADRQQHRLVGAPRGARAVLGQRGQVGVVVDEHRQPEPLGHDRAERDVGERQIDGDDAAPGTLIHQARDPEADRGDLVRPRLARRFLRPLRRRCRARADWSSPVSVRWARWWTESPVSTAPASSLVPPMSTPMVRRPGMHVTICADAQRPRTAPIQALPRRPAGPESAAARRGGARSSGRPSDRARTATGPAPTAAGGSAAVDLEDAGCCTWRWRSSAWLLLSLRAVPGQRPDRARQGARLGEGGAELGRQHADLDRHDPRDRHRPAAQGIQGARRQHAATPAAARTR